MTQPRTRIRQRIEALWAAHVPSARSFTVGRPQRRGDDKCPAGFLFSVSERIDADGFSEMGQAETLAPDTERTYELRLCIVGSESGDAEAEIDTVIGEFEAALNEDDTLDGAAESVAITAILWGPVSDTAAPRSAAELQITAIYRATPALSLAL